MNTKTKKSKKEKARSALSVLLIVAILVAGAFAFLTAQDSKTNVFTIGNIKAELWEKFDVNNNGQLDADEDLDSTIKEPKIENIIPGQTIDKSPYVKNTGSNDAYVFMSVGIPVDQKDNILSDDGTFTYSGDLKIPVKAYVMQKGFGNATNSNEAYSEYFKDLQSIFNAEPTESSGLVELFEVYSGSSKDTKVLGYNSDWTQKDVYRTDDYNYYIFAYNNILPAKAENEVNYPATSGLFNYVRLNEKIGDLKTPSVNFYVPKDDTDPVITTDSVDLDDYILFDSAEVPAGQSIGDLPFEDSFALDGYLFDFVSAEDTSKSAYSNMKMPAKTMNFVANYQPLLSNGDSITNANFLGYQLMLNETTGEFYAKLTAVSMLPGGLNILGVNEGTVRDSRLPYAPSNIDTIEIPSKINLSFNSISEFDMENAYFGSFGVADTFERSALRDALIANNLQLSIPVKEIESANDFISARKVILPDCIEKIEGMSFMSNLEEVNIPNQCTTIGQYVGSESDGSVSSGFYYCSKLTTVHFPNTLKVIGNNAFACTALTEILLPDSIEIVDKNAFQCFNPNTGECTVTNLKIGKNIKELGESAINGGVTNIFCYETLDLSECYQLTKVYDDAINISFANVILPNSLVQVSDYAFRGPYNIIYNGSLTPVREVYFEDKYTSWGAYYFNNWVEDGKVYSDMTKTTLIGEAY